MQLHSVVADAVTTESSAEEVTQKILKISKATILVLATLIAVGMAATSNPVFAQYNPCPPGYTNPGYCNYSGYNNQYNPYNNYCQSTNYYPYKYCNYPSSSNPYNYPYNGANNNYCQSGYYNQNNYCQYSGYYSHYPYNYPYSYPYNYPYYRYSNYCQYGYHYSYSCYPSNYYPWHR